MGDTTTTDSRAGRNRAGRKGGHLLTRALGSSYKSGLPTLSCSRHPLSRMGSPYADGRLGGIIRVPALIMPVTNVIESLHMQLRKIIKNRGHFPNDDAAIKLLWLALRNITDGKVRSAREWKLAMNQFAVLYGDRFVSHVN